MGPDPAVKHHDDAAESAPSTLRARFRGHRRRSFTTEDIDLITEMRARQRTFDGAFVRTALGTLGYALLILKLFSPDFAHIGLLYVILGGFFLLASFVRRRKSIKDFADDNLPDAFFTEEVHQPADKRVWGKKPYQPGGTVILGSYLAVLAVEIAVMVLIFQLD